MRTTPKRRRRNVGGGGKLERRGRPLGASGATISGSGGKRIQTTEREACSMGTKRKRGGLTVRDLEAWAKDLRAVKARCHVESGCWIWDGAYRSGKNGQEYATRSAKNGKGKKQGYYVHRLVCAAMNGKRLSALSDRDVHHTCGNSLCVNPRHLEALPRDVHGVLSNTNKGGSGGEWEAYKEYIERTGG